MDRRFEDTTVLRGAETETARLRGFLLGKVRSSWSAVVSVMAPADCRACCGPLLEVNATGICEACFADLQPERAAVCVLCGERLPWEEARGAGFAADGVGRCDTCFAVAPAFARATAFAPYDGALRTLIRLHKFEGMVALARPLGLRLAPVLAAAADATSTSDAIYVVAVPLFGRRRPFNQSVQIATEALRGLRRTRPELRLQGAHGALVRVRKTESQSHLTPAQRRDNVRGAFAVRGDVAGWTVLLVDDVYTTGATAAECTRVLLRAGAREVRVVTLARTQKESTLPWDSAAAWSTTV